MAIVQFNPSVFKSYYPEFSSASDQALTACFQQAMLYLSNTDASIVQNIQTRAMLFDFLTAHIAILRGLLSADGQARAVGRVSQATEGSVTAGLDYSAATPGTGAWFNQTQYGAMYWQAMAPFRGFHYYPQPAVY